MNILVHTWWFSANKGSEFSVAYNYVMEMSKKHHLYVPVESCSYSWNDLSEFKTLKIPNVEFIFLPLSKRVCVMRFFQKFINEPVAGWMTYSWFNIWEKQLYKKIKKSCIDKIDLIHYLGPAGYHEPGYLWKLDKPYVWGATSGFENVNSELLEKYMSSKKIMKFKQKLNSFKIKHHARVRKAMENSDVVIAATGGNKKIISENYCVKNLKYFPENVMRISRSEILSKVEVKQKFDTLACCKRICVLWCGALTARKMPNILLGILRAVSPTNKFHFDIVGGGELFEWMKSETNNLNINMGGGYNHVWKIA